MFLMQEYKKLVIKMKSSLIARFLLSRKKVNALLYSENKILFFHKQEVMGTKYI